MTRFGGSDNPARPDDPVGDDDIAEAEQRQTVASDEERRAAAAASDARAAVAEGVFIEDAKGVVANDEKTRWQLSERAHARNVSRAFRELEWE